MNDRFREWVLKHNIGPGMNDEAAALNYSGFDGTVGDGWIGILDRLATDLVAMGWDRDLHQVKEKYGTLRFYVGVETPAMAERISQAEDESEVTCETCGAPGELRGHGWLYTACDSHTKPEHRGEDPRAPRAPFVRKPT